MNVIEEKINSTPVTHVSLYSGDVELYRWELADIIRDHGLEPTLGVHWSLHWDGVKVS